MQRRGILLNHTINSDIESYHCFFQDPFLLGSSGWQRLVKVDGMVKSRSGGCRRCFIFSGRDFVHELFCKGTSVRVMLRFTFWIVHLHQSI